MYISSYNFHDLNQWFLTQESLFSHGSSWTKTLFRNNPFGFRLCYVDCCLKCYSTYNILMALGNTISNLSQKEQKFFKR